MEVFDEVKVWPVTRSSLSWVMSSCNWGSLPPLRLLPQTMTLIRPRPS